MIRIRAGDNGGITADIAGDYVGTTADIAGSDDVQLRPLSKACLRVALLRRNL